MPPHRSILCPIDFSEPSRQALAWAEDLAAKRQARLIVLSAVDPLLAETARTRFDLDLVRTDTGPALREFVAGTRPAARSHPADTTFDVRVGDAAEVILEVAAAERPDLLVLGTHGLGGVRKWLLGSTTERVLRRTRVPVLAVPPVEDDLLPAAGGLAAVRRILAATDFSDAAGRAVAWAADFAAELEVPLLLAHVVAPIAVLPQWALYLDEADQARAADAERRMEQLASSLRPRVPCDVAVRLGPPAETIPALAGQRGAGVIVMGLASDQGPFSPRPGSIAYRVVCAGPVPVVVVPTLIYST